MAQYMDKWIYILDFWMFLPASFSIPWLTLLISLEKTISSRSLCTIPGTREPDPKGLGGIRLPLEHQLALPKHLLPRFRGRTRNYPIQCSMKLDDGWPESVEEQGLLLLVWRHHITKHYIKDVL